jgi:hypothetical protein
MHHYTYSLATVVSPFYIFLFSKNTASGFSLEVAENLTPRLQSYSLIALADALSLSQGNASDFMEDVPSS